MCLYSPSPKTVCVAPHGPDLSRYLSSFDTRQSDSFDRPRPGVRPRAQASAAASRAKKLIAGEISPFRLEALISTAAVCAPPLERGRPPATTYDPPTHSAD